MKLLERSITLNRVNVDYQIKYPSEARLPASEKVSNEARIRITKEHNVRMRRTTVPIVERPKRLNRIG